MLMAALLGVIAGKINHAGVTVLRQRLYSASTLS